MFRSPWLAPAVLLTGLIACSDHPAPTAPPASLQRTTPSADLAVHQERNQRLARAFALALADPGFRQEIHGRLEASPFREHKLYFQGLLTAGNRRLLQSLARLSRTDETSLQSDAANAGPLEVYLPVPEHRSRWRGDGQILVATAMADGEVPVAFDIRGVRHELDPRTPPDIPVIAIGPAEVDFSSPGAPEGAKCVDCIPPPPGGGGGGGGGGPGGTPLVPGLYMTFSHIEARFEGWLKGDPEYEVHILGQAGSTDSLTSYQCAGEHAAIPYAFDQNNVEWTGTVLLFSQSQLDSYRAAHPGQSVRIFVVEDDDTACQIKSGTGTLEQILELTDQIFDQKTGARDTTITGTKTVKWANALQDLWRRLASIILTNDEMVGNAVEDVVAGSYYPGANWVVKGENNATNGWLRLEMR